ncbi:MAG: phenylalanine--tRNA ligase subunit beta [Verrucomicrobiales bacterium]|nr:phenylalanine--tRNA ligase subunit beta [Verrucomicrobiales bacterium]
MKITLNWLREYVDFAGSAEELAERLTLLGLEVESVSRTGGGFEGIVVAEVLSREKHPNADKLSLCRVADGHQERQIVCGAQNFQAGDKVPLILPGATLPMKPGDKEPFTIKVGKIRGVESHGMLCSATELGIRPEDFGHRSEDGLLILRKDAPVGQPLAAYLGIPEGDTILDLEITPNRPDWNSLIGIARELAADTKKDLRIPDIQVAEAGVPVADAAEVRIEAPDLCPRYTARLVRGVKVGPSPDWLRSALEKVGLRSINNVVDVTNYVMLETGQPLHAFDVRRLAAGQDGRVSIIVRRPAAQEAFVTLDGVGRSLASDDLLIADGSKAIALAGVMGGENSGIADGTTEVLIESATFSPTQVRRTSKRLGLRTDASYRFERGADPGICEWASRRCAELIVRTAGGAVAPGVIDVQPTPWTPKVIPLRIHRAGEVLGVEVSREEQMGFLNRLGLEPVDSPVETAGAVVGFRIPSWRPDLKREVDLIEEIARLYGVDRIPATPPRGAKGAHPFDAVHDQMSEVRELLCALGLGEAKGQTLVKDAVAGKISDGVVALTHPLSAEMSVLRPSLLPGLLDILGHNATRRNTDVRLFEIGRVFRCERDLLHEGWRLAVVLTGARDPGFWSGADRGALCDFYDLKGIVEELLENLGLRGIHWSRVEASSDWWWESATVSLGGRLPLGKLGQIRPALAKQYGLRHAVLMAELDLDVLLARRQSARQFKPLPQYPASQRDVAIIVPEDVTHESVLAAVRKVQPAHLEAVELFDVFRGRHVPEGFKSLAYAFTYRAVDRTLKDEEVNAAQEALISAFKTALKATVRE